MRLVPAVLAAFVAALSVSVHAALNVFATVPEWGALAKELGGERVTVYTATTALQDPHHVEARPSLIARARGADLVVATGAELEIGWLPLVLQQAGNAKVQPGRPGYFETAAHVALLGKPAPDRGGGRYGIRSSTHIQTVRATSRVWRRRSPRACRARSASDRSYQER